MINASADRALTVFDDYLRYMREADAPVRHALRPAPWMTAGSDDFSTDDITDAGITAHHEATSPRRSFNDEPTVISSRSSRPPADPATVFVNEMRTLIKYGHKPQVSREIEKWLERNGADLNAQLGVVQFWIEQIDATAGREELFGLASRAIGRGEVAVAHAVIDRLAREMAGDTRVESLRRRLAEG